MNSNIKLLEDRAELYTRIIVDKAMDSDSVALMAINYKEMRPLEDEDFSETTFRWKGSSVLPSLTVVMEAVSFCK